ncbi:unnamed protein product [Ambrosiozyma monospora]|uniref:Unnamed protein product n=1 Tax=Ambrosiozyma monospora TaxID=43982 RepID=A0ACB5TED8_AMBMO|nr:unnamed protein product [Ambrosiozyma monospora]
MSKTTATAKPSFKIRPVQKEDKSGFVDIFNGPKDSYVLFRTSEISAESSAKVFDRFMDSNVPAYCNIALVDYNEEEHTHFPNRRLTGTDANGQDEYVIGCATFLTHVNIWSGKDELYLSDLFVSEFNRVKGVGKD